MIQLVIIRDRVTSMYFGGRPKPGDVVWVRNETEARELIEAGICRLHRAGPTATKPAGPSETKEADPAAPVRPRGPLRRSHDWPLDRFSVIERTWNGETAVCVGGGPGVTAEAVAELQGRARCIAINDSYQLAPWADVCYFADSRWWEWHKDRPAFVAFAGQKCTIENTGMMIPDPEIFMLHNYGSDGLSVKPNGLHTGSNSGFQAINLAVLAGAKRILLLGYDMRFPGGKSHWHGGHPVRIPEQNYLQYARRFKSMLPQLKAWGIEVINCTPGSAIDAFPFGNAQSLLADPAPALV